MFSPLIGILVLEGFLIFDQMRLPKWWESLQTASLAIPILITTVIAIFFAKLSLLRWPTLPFYSHFGVIGFTWSATASVGIYFSVYLTDYYLFTHVVLPGRIARSHGSSFPSQASMSLPTTAPTIDLIELLLLTALMSVILITICGVSCVYFRKSLQNSGRA